MGLTMKIYLVVMENLNGELTIEAFSGRDEDYLSLLLEEPPFYPNCGSPLLTIRIPDGSSPKFYGFDVWSLETIKEYLGL